MSADPPTPPSPHSAPWWHDFHDEHLAAILLERHDPAEVERTLDFILGALEPGPGAHLFDQCCGIGSLALPLARRGVRVTGVDQAANYIDRARRDAQDAGVDVDYFAADAGEFRPAEPCDGAFNWWTSFGYADDDEVNQRMLRRALEALRPGARFLLDTMNVAGVLRRFQPRVVTRRALADGELVLVRESELDLAAGALHKRWTYTLPRGGEVVHHSRVRIYLPHELGRLLMAVGFVELEYYGDIDGRPLGLDDLRCIVRARRPR